MPLPTGTRFPIQVISTIKPINNGQFPVVEDADMLGGYQIRADLTDRNNIPVENRKEGMLVFVKSNANFYILSGGTSNSNWVAMRVGNKRIITIVTSTPYNILPSDDLLIFDTGAAVANMPASPNDGYSVTITLSGNISTLLINGNGSLINQNTGYTLNDGYASRDFTYDLAGATWRIVGSYIPSAEPPP